MILSDTISFFSFLKPSNIRKWFDIENLFVNYFWFYSFGALIALLFNNGLINNLAFPLIIYLIFLKKCKRINLNIIDLLWIGEFFWVVLSWVINDYPHKSFLISKTICLEMSFMFSYWIARCSPSKRYVQLIIEYSTKPLVIVSIIGIYCFFLEPDWYLKTIEDSIAEVNGHSNFSKESILELYRLKSIYISPYSLAYFCAFVLIYSFFLFFANDKRLFKSTNIFIMFMILLLVTDVLCMMRGPLLCVFLGFMIAYFYSLSNNRNHNSMSVLMLLLVCLLMTSITYLDLSIANFMIEKFNEVFDDDDSFVTKRFLLQARDFSIIGDGYGRYHALASIKFGLPSIPDGEYVKIIAEQGFVGLFIVILMFLLGLLKAIINFKYLYFELCLLFMLLICMIGADPLSFGDKHCFLFWMALGQASSFYKPKVLRI